MSKKIYELAKEMNLGSLELVEKLKGYGFSVRNHMSSLSDEEVETVLLKSKPPKIKKITKRKVTKKKISAAQSEEKKAEKSLLKKTARRKIVIRKKVLPKEIVEESLKDISIVEPKEVPEENVETEVTETVPLPKEIIEKEPEEELFKEKAYVFTPVFIPEPIKEVEKEPVEKSEVVSPESSEKTSTTKKKIGDLASMMSGKKTTISKSQTINQTRADSELKTYAALRGTGRPLYTQVKRKRIFTGSISKTELTDVKDVKRIIKIHDGCTAGELAKKLSIKLNGMIDKCLEINLLIEMKDYVGFILASEIAALYRYRVENIAFNEDQFIDKKVEVSGNSRERNPVITVMGHIDHGKTTLLDYIRKTKIVNSEAGGITQHIAAYTVEVNEKKLTFLDTPGHAAFTNMRERSIDLTDIAIIVVAADDGVMPQTKESILYCQKFNVPIIIAVNKIDKVGVDLDKLKKELSDLDIISEEWGGSVQFYSISALTGEGIDHLLEGILLQAEILELQASFKGRAEGVVLESHIEQGRGIISTILLQSGMLSKGESIVVGETYGRVRSLRDHSGKDLKSAGPSTPVMIFGLNNVPLPGELFHVVKNEREAKKIVDHRTEQKRLFSLQLEPKDKVSLEDFFSKTTEENNVEKVLKLIIRADVQGSFEAIKNSLETLSNDEIKVVLLGGGIGPITDFDVNFANDTGAFLIGFNMRPLTSAYKISNVLQIDIKTYSIIYKLIDDVKLAMEGLLDPDQIEEFMGRVEVKEIFTIPKVGVIAGSVVIEGKIQKGCCIRLLREEKILFDGKMTSLKRFKDDVKEVKNGVECGVQLDNYDDIKVGDLFESYSFIERKRTLKDIEENMILQKTDKKVTTKMEL